MIDVKCSSTNTKLNCDANCEIYNEWTSIYNQPEIEVIILIPNGLITTLTVTSETKLFEIKEVINFVILEGQFSVPLIVYSNCQEVFDLAGDLPMYGALYDRQGYIFTCVNFTTGEQEEIDETRTINDVKPFMKILRLLERKGNIASKQLNAQIGPLIGKGTLEH